MGSSVYVDMSNGQLMLVVGATFDLTLASEARQQELPLTIFPRTFISFHTRMPFILSEVELTNHSRRVSITVRRRPCRSGRRGQINEKNKDTDHAEAITDIDYDFEATMQ